MTHRSDDAEPAGHAPRDGAVYLDHNATTPVDPLVADAMRPYLERWFGNPSSAHTYGTEPEQALARARDDVGALLGARGDEIVFTGSGSEADNLAIRGAALTTRNDRPQVITQVTEHPAVLETCRALERLHGAEVTYLPVDQLGIVDPAALAAALTSRTVLVSIMAANNETGAVQPIAELARVAREHGALFHCDAAQAAGKIPLSVTELGVDMMTVVGHKMYAPKGVGALYVRSGVALEPLIYGGAQENGLRAGTESVALAVALGTAARLAADDLASGGHGRMKSIRDRLHARLTDALADRVDLNGPADQRLPNTLNISIRGTLGHDLLAAVPGLAASTGSACHEGSVDVSPVLSAMGLDIERSRAAVRLSVGRPTTTAEVDLAAELLVEAVHALPFNPGVSHPSPTEP